MRKNFSVRWFNIDKDITMLNDEQKGIVHSISKKNAVNIHQNNNMAIPMNANKNMNININMNMNMMNNAIQQNQNTQPINPAMNNQFMQHNNQIGRNVNMNMNMNMNVYQGMQMINQQNQIGNTMNMKMPLQQFYPNQNYLLSQMNMIQNQPSQNIQQMQGNINNMYNNNMMMNNKGNQMNNEYIEEKGSYVKFTCRFEMLIPNDQDFQVVRRLIGSKGCNMKRIVDSCKNEATGQSNVKLRLRGKGSGFKEGPLNKESDEPLHLCISAKNQECLKIACELVEGLIDKIYEDYKNYCWKIGINPPLKIANRVDDVNSMFMKNNMNIQNNHMHMNYL